MSVCACMCMHLCVHMLKACCVTDTGLPRSDLEPSEFSVETSAPVMAVGFASSPKALAYVEGVKAGWC